MVLCARALAAMAALIRSQRTLTAASRHEKAGSGAGLQPSMEGSVGAGAGCPQSGLGTDKLREELGVLVERILRLVGDREQPDPDEGHRHGEEGGVLVGKMA